MTIILLKFEMVQMSDASTMTTVEQGKRRICHHVIM
jgi:hypothetical protein